MAVLLRIEGGPYAGIDRRTLQRKMIAWGFREPRPAENDEG
jgi:hypothetical protein